MVSDKQTDDWFIDLGSVKVEKYFRASLYSSTVYSIALLSKKILRES